MAPVGAAAGLGGCSGCTCTRTTWECPSLHTKGGHSLEKMRLHTKLKGKETEPNLQPLVHHRAGTNHIPTHHLPSLAPAVAGLDGTTGQDSPSLAAQSLAWDQELEGPSMGVLSPSERVGKPTSAKVSFGVTWRRKNKSKAPENMLPAKAGLGARSLDGA